MKTYRELYFKGSSEELCKFINEIENYTADDWSSRKGNSDLKDYIIFNYDGEKVDKASIYIYTKDYEKDNEIMVNNIVPDVKAELTIDEYNEVLLQFYNDIIKPYKENNPNIDIQEPSGDLFNPIDFISEESLKKLESFCKLANKSTGSYNQSDRERWFDFICQTVDDGKMFDSYVLANFLSDESYWGKKPDELIGVIGNYAWSKEMASKLADEYDILCEILIYYKDRNGIE